MKTARDPASGFDALLRARRRAYQIPGAEIFDNIDSAIQSVYTWQRSDERHARLFQCDTLDDALLFSRMVSDMLRESAIQGSTQPWSEGRVYVELWDRHDSQMRDRVDALYEETFGGMT